MPDSRWGEKTRQNDQEIAQQKIIASAKQCFAEKSIGTVTIADIARIAKINRRTVYRYFDSKQAIVEYIVDEQAVEFLDEMQQVLSKHSNDFPALLKAYIHYLVEHGPQAQGHQMLLGSKNINNTRQMYFSSKNIYRMWDAIMREPFNQALAQGQIRKTVDYKILMEWVGRLVFSFIEMPAERKQLDCMVEQFLCDGICP